jgi:hypothetical protein
LQRHEATRSTQRQTSAAGSAVAGKPILAPGSGRLAREANANLRALIPATGLYLDCSGRRSSSGGRLLEHRAQHLHRSVHIGDDLERRVGGKEEAALPQCRRQRLLRQLQKALQGDRHRRQRRAAVLTLLGQDEGIKGRERAVEPLLDALRHRAADVGGEAAQPHEVERCAQRAERVA